MQIKTIYQMVTLQGRTSPRQYIDTRKQTTVLPKKFKKKQTYVKDIEKLSKHTPGPGQYIINPQDAKLSKIISKKVDFKSLCNIPKKTYVDQLIKKKNKIPGVGKYQTEHDHTQEIRHKYSIFGDKTRKQANQFKTTIFDQFNLDSLKVDPASYNTIKPLGSPKKYQAFILPPPVQQVNQKQKLKQKSQSLPKIPGPQTYHPIPPTYSTFDMISSRNSLHQNNPYSRKKAKKRLSELKQISPGPKYSLIAQWSPKNKDIIKNMFKSTKNLIPKSIYH